jgi:CHAT domain-containing protein
MILGKYGQGGEELPRVLHVSIARYRRDLPKAGESLQFLVAIHEEGTGVTWQQNVTIKSGDERFFLDTTRDLYLWSLNAALTPAQAQKRLRALGSRLYDAFLGPDGKKVLESVVPTAVLLNVDETILNLPWELIGPGGNALAQRTPFGRLVTTRVMPRPSRDPTKEDKIVRLLAIANPTLDLAGADREIAVLKKLEGRKLGFSLEVQVLAKDLATRAAFAERLAQGDYDILHFSGHGSFDPAAPETSAIRFADGRLTADEVLDLKWKEPPHLVFNSSCESGRAAGGQRLVSEESHTNGLAAAFIAAGAAAYAGYFWPVTDTGASLFAAEFYQKLFLLENVGLAFLEARQSVIEKLGEAGDLTGYSAILFGDAASQHRRDLATAV